MASVLPMLDHRLAPAPLRSVVLPAPPLRPGPLASNLLRSKMSRRRLRLRPPGHLFVRHWTPRLLGILQMVPALPVRARRLPPPGPRGSICVRILARHLHGFLMMRIFRVKVFHHSPCLRTLVSTWPRCSQASSKPSAVALMTTGLGVHPVIVRVVLECRQTTRHRWHYHEYRVAFYSTQFGCTSP